jgi:predicted TIM-barrel fold metal-dependent hydrolase
MEAGVDDSDYQAEARLIAGMVGTGGMLGQIASCRPEEDVGFDPWLEECDSLHVVGFRRILHVVPDGISQSETFRRNLRKIGERGLPFDLCVLARQHDLTLDLLRACDDQVFVLDHCGNPDIAADAFAPWAASLRRIAEFPNVVIKLSGITANARADQVNAAGLQPYVDHVLDCFGPDRMLWGGDWPVCDLGSGLPGWISLTHQFLAGLSESERAAIGTGTARRIYRV